MIIDVEFYLSRNDRIVLSKNGEFRVIEGIPSETPQLPSIPNDSIVLYNIDVPAYTFNTDDVTISLVKQRRYTMNDIGKIVTRLENVEQVASLSLLETKLNSKQDLNKFRNGFFVDNFQSQFGADNDDPQHYIGYDFNKGEIRPTNLTYNIDLKRNTQTGVKIHDDGIITLNYSEVPFVSNELASQVVRIQPYMVTDFVGGLTLNPSTDIWIETSTVDITIENNVSTPRFFINNAPRSLRRRFVGTMWDFIDGVYRNVANGSIANREETEILRGLIARGNRNVVTSVVTTTTREIQSVTTQNSVVPFIRSRLISFNVVNLKPQSRVYVKFDGVDISQFAGPTEGTIGQPLITSGGGTLSGVFRIPNDDSIKFRTGQRRVIISDKPGNTEDFDSSIADAVYVANGTLQTTTNTFLNTRNTVTTTRVRRVRDPLAQSFFVKDDEFLEGVFISSIDVYFGPGIDPTTNKESVTLELRNMINGYPGPDVPHNGSVTVQSSQIFGSADASRATRFTFPSPIYLEDDNEYCFVLKSNSTVLNVW